MDKVKSELLHEGKISKIGGMLFEEDNIITRLEIELPGARFLTVEPCEHKNGLRMILKEFDPWKKEDDQECQKK